MRKTPRISEEEKVKMKMGKTETEKLLEQIADVRRDASTAKRLAAQIHDALVHLNRDGGNYHQSHLSHDALVLVTVADSLLTGVEGWQEDIRDGNGPVGDCPACGGQNYLPKESCFKCSECAIELVRELKVGVVRELTVGEMV